MISILIVDDHAIVRAGLCHTLRQVADFSIAGEADNGQDGIAAVERLQPDVVLMDVFMPGINGLEATRTLVRKYQGIRILMLSMYNDGPIPARALSIGASGYLSKACAPRQLERAVRTVFAGQHFIGGELAPTLPAQMYGLRGSILDDLSERELQIMAQVAVGNSIDEIAGQMSLNRRTIRTFRQRIFSKLGIQTDAQMTRLAIQYGLTPPLVMLTG